MSVLIVVGFWMMLISILGMMLISILAIMLDIFPLKYRSEASFRDRCMFAMSLFCLACWIVASILFAFKLV
jgi:hypothetical protein